MSSKVLVDDNFHYRDESERYEVGEYQSYDAAVTVCKMVVDRYPASAFKVGMTAAELHNNCVSFGEDSYVVPRRR